MIQTIPEQALLCADVLEKTVRGIRPRVGALASPREGEPMEYVLVLADIITANDKDKVLKNAYRLARYKYDTDKLKKYKSACLCNIEFENFQSNEQVYVLEQVDVLELCVMMGDITLH